MDVGEARALSELLELIHQPRIAHCGGAPAGIISSTHTVKRRSSPGCGGMFALYKAEDAGKWRVEEGVYMYTRKSIGRLGTYDMQLPL